MANGSLVAYPASEHIAAHGVTHTVEWMARTSTARREQRGVTTEQGRAAQGRAWKMLLTGWQWGRRHWLIHAAAVLVFVSLAAVTSTAVWALVR